MMLDRRQRALLRAAHDSAAELHAGANKFSDAALDAFLHLRDTAADRDRAINIIVTAAAGAADAAGKITTLRNFLHQQGILPAEPSRCGRIRRLENHAAGAAAGVAELEKSMFRTIARHARVIDAG